MNPTSPTPYFIRFFRGLRLVFHFLWIGFGAAFFYPLVDEKRRDQLKRCWSHRILKILSVRFEAPPSDIPPGNLIVANHVSWLDIFAVNSFRPVAFISKAEIRRWPFIGWLAEKYGTIFLHRGSRGHARIVNSAIDTQLNAHRDVAIFPEGTTTNGTQLLGFHAALLQPAIETGCPILPLAISYLDHEGKISLAPSFSGETTLLQCVWAILACRSLTVCLTPAPSIETKGKTRRELANVAHAAIEVQLTTRNGFLPANSPPEGLLDLQAE